MAAIILVGVAFTAVQTVLASLVGLYAALLVGILTIGVRIAWHLLGARDKKATSNSRC